MLTEPHKSLILEVLRALLIILFVRGPAAWPDHRVSVLAQSIFLDWVLVCSKTIEQNPERI